MTFNLSVMTHKLIRHAVCAFILLITLLVAYPLSIRVIAGIHILQGDNHGREGFFGLALEKYRKAARYLPDDFEINKSLGETWYTLGNLKQRAKESWPLLLRSKELYERAKQLNPLDAEASYGLARAEYRLEDLYKYLNFEKDKKPYNALPWFREAVKLRPNSITFRYAMARYLYSHEMDDLLPVIRTLVRVYPPSYYNLKREEFWSDEVREEVKKGLEEALDENSSPRDTHRAMSSIFAEEGKWEKALSHYEYSLRYRSFQNVAGDYIQLGYLNLKKGDLATAETRFITGLDRSMIRESDLSRIYSYYRAEGRRDAYYHFYGLVKERFMTSIPMDILFAQSLIEQEEYDRAREVLIDVNKRGNSAVAYYWLARIAEKEQDWDNMELLIQKATVLDSGNSSYHLIFSRVLRRLNKLESAEKEATLAIQSEKRPSPWTFNHRASIRWTIKDYEGAAKDWRNAISLKSDYAPFYAQAAEAYASIAYWPLAAEYYLKALDLDPDNERYKKRYSQLEEYSK